MANPGAQSSAAFPINMASWASVLPRPILVAPKLMFTYSLSWKVNGVGTQLAASGSQRASVTVQNDSHFLAVTALGRVTASDDTTLPTGSTGIVLQFSDTSGQMWSNEFQRWDAFIGTASAPFYWPFPRLIPKNTTVNCDLTNELATARDVQIVLWGFKCFTDWTPVYGASGS